MLKHASLLAVLAASLLAGCSQTPPQTPTAGNLAFNDFDNLDGWLADSPALITLSQEKAHSGKYSTMVSSDYAYSLGYNNTLGRLSPDWPAKLKISAWVLLPSDQAAAKLVAEVKSADTQASNLLWQGLELPKAVKTYNAWQYVEQTIVVPNSAKANSRLLVYLWRADSKVPVYLDDLTIALAR